MNNWVRKAYFVWFDAYPTEQLEWFDLMADRDYHFRHGGSQESFKLWFLDLLQDALSDEQADTDALLRGL